MLNDQFIRDSVDMISFKYGGKIKVLGYITNMIGDSSLKGEGAGVFAELTTGLNETMRPFFSNQPTLRIVHPIAIFYE